MTLSDQKALELIKNGIETPFYIYDVSHVTRQIEKLQSSFSEDVQILYSMKSNPHLGLLKFIQQKTNLLVDVSSIGEVMKALDAGFSPQRMSFVGPGKSKKELEWCVLNQIGIVVVESETELHQLHELTQIHKKQITVLIRVALSKTMSLTGRVRENHLSHFGISQDLVDKVLKNFDVNQQYGFLKLGGLHCYVQSQYLNVDHLLFNFKSAFDLHMSLSNRFQSALQYLNVGGGLGVAYFEGQKELDLLELKEKWQLLVTSYKKQGFQSQLLMECGRFMVAELGQFYTRVLYLKQNFGHPIAVLDGGFTQNASAVGTGQSIRRHFPIKKVSTDLGDELSSYTLVGPSCYSLDVIAQDISLKKLQIEDLLSISMCGGYGPSFSPQNFLSRPEAKEFLIGI